jgi:peptidoglycan/xylan/chitin deacetylase (PgdA/CDA1 family)
MHSFFLTFDTEDFISENSVPGLHNILELLKRHELPALFFITGNMAEKLSNFPATVDLLSEHQIGYHTSSHSIHPALFEFTDVKSYDEALQTSLIRETAHINPLTGAVEGSGGIHALRALFPKKQLVSYRAPGYCWTPPHLDALKTLGITYDFSTNISIKPISYHGITFYPFTILLINWQGGIRQHGYLQKITLKREVSVLTIHPSTMVNQLDWDIGYYHKGNNLKLNPITLAQPPPRTPSETASIFLSFDFLLRHLKALKKINLLKVTPELKMANSTLRPSAMSAAKCYEMSMAWAKGFGYEPQFLYGHFMRFFEIS